MGSNLAAESEKVVFDWVVPVVMIGGALLLGMIFERIILHHLRKIAERTTWKGDEIIISGLKGVTTLWFVLAGAFFASYSLPVTASVLLLIHKVLMVLVILSGTLVASRIAIGFVNLSTIREDGALPSASILSNLTKLSVFLIGILIILQSLGISITPLLTALGVGGLAVALALQDTLSNLFAGVHLLASKKIRPGDFVGLDTGQEGTVVDIGWRNTTIRTLSNNMVILPNSKLSTAVVTSYFQPDKEMAVVVPVSVTYDSDLAKVEHVTVEVAKSVMREVPGAVPTFEPFIRFNSFGDSGVGFSVILRAQEYVAQYLIKHEFVKRLHARYQQEGIVFPYPTRVVYMKTDQPDESDTK
ncbi:MAG: mechanosensitive ion channel family protein [Candidatus Zixiibacteriota bacterium]